MRYRQTCCYDSTGAIVTKALRSVRLAATKTGLYRDWYAHCIVCATLGSGLHCSLALVASGREVITDWIPQAVKLFSKNYVSHQKSMKKADFFSNICAYSELLNYWVATTTDCFEPIFGFLVQFCFQKHRSDTWDPKGMFSAPSGRSENG